MRRFIIDTDTAADDAAALVYMLRLDGIKVEAVTTVMGNVPMEKATQNALLSIEMAGTYAPAVYKGCARPILREPFYAMNVHGDDGLGNSGLRPQRLNSSDKHAIDAICDIIMQNPYEIELLTLGPLTNIALAYLKCPQIARLLKNVVVMGGSGFEKGNVTEYAEFNIYADAEAAKIVLSGGMPVTLVGCELSTDECALYADEVEMLEKSADKGANFIHAATKRLREFDLETYGKDEIYIPDAVAAAIAVDSSVSSYLEPVFADVEVNDKARYGQVVMTRNPQKPNALLAHKADSKRFKEMFYNSVLKADK